MIYIYTNKDAIPENFRFIIDAEAEFDLKSPGIKKMFPDYEYVKQYLMDAMKATTVTDDGVVKAECASVPLDSLSTGIKAGVLAVMFNNELVVSTDEAGYNVIFALFKIARQTDVRIYSCCSYTVIPDDVTEAYINDELITGDSDDILAAMDDAYEYDSEA